MRKLLDTKAGATFYEEMPNRMLSTRKDCIEFIFKPHFQDFLANLKFNMYICTQNAIIWIDYIQQTLVL